MSIPYIKVEFKFKNLEHLKKHHNVITAKSSFYVADNCNINHRCVDCNGEHFFKDCPLKAGLERHKSPQNVLSAVSRIPAFLGL